MLAWGALFVFRKTALEGTPWNELLGHILSDHNFWAGLILVPAGWLKDDALIDQLVVEKCRVGDPYLEITMKERQ